MILHIHDNLKVADIQERFSECFPMLKIEFYTKANLYKEMSDRKDLVNPDTLIGDLRQNFEQGELALKSWDKTSHVEQLLETQFGLHAQICRKEGNRWVQTSKTDNLTLAQQQENAALSMEDHTISFTQQLDEMVHQHEE